MPVPAQKFRLCSHCATREGGDPSFEAAGEADCYICGGLFEKIPATVGRAVKSVRRHEFRTFAVGITLPEGVQEREDELRSSLRLKGNETVKTQAAKLFARQVSSRLGKPIDKMRPDLTILASMADGTVSVSSRPIFYYGRYSKRPGIAQKREYCEHCSGRGCPKCEGTGYDKKLSVEKLLRDRLSAFCGSEKLIFTWIGSEDEESRVHPPGRPFVAELKNPVRRRLPKSFVGRSRGNQVAVKNGRLLPSRPLGLPPFRFRTVIRCVASGKIDAEGLKELKKAFRRTMVRFDRPHGKPATKTVYSATGRARGRNLTVDAVMDGGLPVKRFVSGELVTPSVSEVLKTEVRCRSFDICGVEEKGKFSYGEITRV